MNVAVFSRSLRGSQASNASNLPHHLVCMTATARGEFKEPANFIREASRAISVGKVVGRNPATVALKALGLLLGASLRAKAINGWSSDGSYNALKDFEELRFLAATKLGPVRGKQHPVTKLRDVLDVAVCRPAAEARS